LKSTEEPASQFPAYEGRHLADPAAAIEVAAAVAAADASDAKSMCPRVDSIKFKNFQLQVCNL
jgi:hypothetical protein